MNILFFVLKTKLLKNGEAPILMRVTINGQYDEIRTQRSVPLKQWNAAKGRSIGKGRAANDLNEYLTELNSLALQKHKELMLEQAYITPRIVLKRVFGKETELRTLLKTMQEEIENMRKVVNIDYSPITREGSEIDIRFYDDNNADQAYIFSLDDQNRISKIEYYYVTNGELDGGPISTYTFTYNENLLTSIDDSEWENNLYKATYSDGNLSSVTVMGEDASCESSNLKNNYSMDLNLLPIGALSEFDNSLIIANILGLIPSTPYLISNISAGGTEMPIEYTETEGAVEAITMEGTLDITLTTEMEVTEIEAAE